jgi:DNA-binding HxlR family transcriptional regulator
VKEPDILRITSKKGSVEILKQLKFKKMMWSELARNVELSRTDLDRKLKLLMDCGLIGTELDYSETKTGKKVYFITDLGLKILGKIEEMEKIFKANFT